MRRLLADPLVHFLAAGALLFALFAAVSDGGDERPDRIVVTPARVAALARTFQRTWMRPPTGDELRGLVDDFVTEEILYREALALGLDRDDLVVRRRMRQKMEFLTEELSASDPTEAELAAYLEEHPDRFARPRRTSFRQVYLDTGRGDAPTEARARELLERLRADEVAAPEATALGDATLLPRALERATPDEIARQYGGAFAAALDRLAEGAWHGPIRSAFGLHLVRVDAREPGFVPSLDGVREAVARELAVERRAAARERFLDGLRRRYDIELPAELPDAPATASR